MRSKIVLITTIVFLFSLTLTGQQQTSDGGYIIAGSTNSYTHGGTDIVVYKLNAAGTKQWRKNYGGGDGDYYSRIIQTDDGGYAVCGDSYTYTHGSDDFLLYKVDAAGAKQWRKNYGGIDHDDCKHIIQTADGGYAVSGSGYSYTNGMRDLLVYKLSASGAKEWRKNYGGAGFEGGGYITQTSDGGYILCGRTTSYSNGNVDFLVYKLDAAGAKQWRKNYGGTDYESSTVVRQTSDGGYIVGGYGKSYSDMNNFMVYKLSASGAKLWRKNYGGEYSDHLYDLRQTADGGYILFGDSRSYGHASSDYDMLLYKVNSAGVKQWRKNYGGIYGDYGWMAFTTGDGNIFLYGDSETYVHGTPGDDCDLLIYKVNAAGAKLWRKNYGGVEIDWAVPK